MRCASCGHENVAGRTYCGKCGEPIRPDRQSVVSQTAQRSVSEEAEALSERLTRALVLGLFLLALAVGFRAVNRPGALPRFQEGAVAPVMPRLPVSNLERLGLPWILLPVPETPPK